MRRLLLLAALFVLPAFAATAEPSAPSEFVVVLNVFVEVNGTPASSVGGATMSRGWLASWSAQASERREVTLQPVGADGRPGTPTTYRGCALAGHSALQNSSNVVGSVRFSCEE